MLPSSQYQCYQEFKSALEQLREFTATPELEVVALQNKFQDLQQLFQSQIISLSADDLDSDDISRWQSFQTEIYKQMRLLQTDIMLLQASRNPATFRSRQTSVSDRINTLIQYCEVLLQL